VVNETIRLSGRTPDGGEGGKAEVRESEAKDAQGRKLWFVEFVVGGEGEETKVGHVKTHIIFSIMWNVTCRVVFSNVPSLSCSHSSLRPRSLSTSP
jgi:hypothetical protein